MSTMTINSQLTLVELAKRTNNKDLLLITEVLNETNELLDDAVWIEGNQTISHKGSQRTFLPVGTWRRINSGVEQEASATKQIVEPMGMLEAYSTVDKKLVEIAPNPMEFRSQEDLAFVEGLSQSLIDAIIYGNLSTDPEKFDGLATRYSKLADTNVLGQGGTGSDTTSVWIIQWGPTRCHLVYPRGSQSIGIGTRDLGEQTVYDANSNPYQAFRTHFEINCGLFVHDQRCVQRLANIETAGATNTLDDDSLVILLGRMLQRGVGAVIYANRTICTQLDILAKDKTNVNYTSADVFGKPTTLFRGVPVKLVDALLDTETAIA